MKNKNIMSAILHFPLIRILCGCVVCYAVFYLVIAGLPTILYFDPSTSAMVIALITALVAATLALLAYYILYNAYEQRTITELASKNILAKIGIGVSIGAGLQLITIATIAVLAHFEFVQVNSIVQFLPTVLIGFAAPVIEEIIFRGIIFRIIEEKMGSFIALLVSALVLGAMEFFKHDATIFTTLVAALELGILFAAAYTVFRNLWVLIAMHFAWSFTTGHIFGLTTMGSNIENTLLTSRISGSPLLTGINSDISTSLPAIIITVIATSILLIIAYRRDNFISPAWKKNSAVLN